MGKSTISTGPFSIAMLNYQRVNGKIVINHWIFRYLTFRQTLLKASTTNILDISQFKMNLYNYGVYINIYTYIYIIYVYCIGQFTNLYGSIFNNQHLGSSSVTFSTTKSLRVTTNHLKRVTLKNRAILCFEITIANLRYLAKKI